MKELIFLKELIFKSDKSKEFMICHYWYFKGIVDKYEPYVCNICHDLLMMEISVFGQGCLERKITI